MSEKIEIFDDQRGHTAIAYVDHNNEVYAVEFVASTMTPDFFIDLEKSPHIKQRAQREVNYLREQVRMAGHESA